MAGEAAAVLATIRSTQTVLQLLQAILQIFGFLCPSPDSINTITSTSFDYIIVGAGSTGSVLARRLTECENTKVLLIEAGGCIPLESALAGYFTLQPLSYQDYNMTAVNDGYSCQNLQGNSVGLTVGKMLGGSSGIHHMLHTTGSPIDYDNWVKITGNSTWGYKNILKYLRKSENVTDPQIVKEYPDFHGTSGPIKLKRQTSSSNRDIIASFVEMGYKAKSDNNNNETTGIVEPLFELNLLRQSGLVSYISPVKDRSNLYVLTNSTVTKVLLNSKNVATGVQLKYSDTTYTVKASQVILAAGAIKTPQLLMLSGIGNATHLSEKNITTLVNNTYVGENLHDHVGAFTVIRLKKDTSAAVSPNPFEFPAPTTCAYGAFNSSQIYPDFQSINLVFPANSTGLQQLCLNTFKYKIDICQRIYNGNINRQVLFLLPNLMMPASRGNIRLNTTNINDQPIVDLNYFTNGTDLVQLAKALSQVMTILNTKKFKAIGAEMIDLGLCSNYTFNTTEYWQCYALAMSTTFWHFSGTCRIGTCVDNSLNVVGTKNLRVVDASILPTVIRGNINAAVVAVAEVAADIIKTEDNLSCAVAPRKKKHCLYRSKN